MPSRAPAVAALALVACSPPAAPIPAPVAAEPTASSPTPALTAHLVTRHACAYEMDGTPITIASPMTRPDGAAAGGKVLLAYQQRAGIATAIHARLFQPDKPPGSDRLLTPTTGIYTEAEVVPHGARFLVTWHQERPRDNHQGRWVDSDGTLGPVMDLPFPDLRGRGLMAHGAGFSATYETSRDHGSTLYHVELDADLKPIGAPLAVDDAQFFSGLSLQQLELANGEVWLAAEAGGRRGQTSQIHLVRMNASGTVIGTVDEVSTAKRNAMLPTLVEVPGGVLFAWIEIGWYDNVGTLWTRKLGFDGTPVGPPLEIGPSGSQWEGLELVIDAGEPLLITQMGRNLRLDADGAPIAGATALEPMANHSIWLAAMPVPFLAWADHGDESALMFAALRCARDTIGPR